MGTTFYTYYLRNRERSEALAVSEYPLRGSFTLMRFVPFVGGYGVGQDYGNGFFIRAVALTFPPAVFPALTIDRGRFRMAQRRRARARAADRGGGVVERAVTIPAFPLANPGALSTRQ